MSVGDNESNKLLMCLLRIIVMDEDDFFHVQAQFSGSFRSIRELNLPINIKNETKALELLASMCDDYLGRYPTTLEEDQAMLAEGAAHWEFAELARHK